MQNVACSPIMVSGLGRSGSTWMQFFLSSHPDVHIHGQSPNIPWNAFWKWRQTLHKQAEWAVQANAHVGYKTAHYAGSPPEHADNVFRRMFYDFMTNFGPRSAQWGLKWIGLCVNPKAVKQWETLWPDTRWIVCIRNPFSVIESLKNTFEPDLDPARHARRWVATCRFAETHSSVRTIPFSIDHLSEQSPSQRFDFMRNMTEKIALPWTESWDELIDQWPLVHKAKSDEKRTFRLTPNEKRRLLRETDGLAALMERWGYKTNLT
jgi:hypothetical protein